MYKYYIRPLLPMGMDWSIIPWIQSYMINHMYIYMYVMCTTPGMVCWTKTSKDLRYVLHVQCTTRKKKRNLSTTRKHVASSTFLLPSTTVRYMSVIFKKYQMSPLYLKFPISNYFTTTCKMAPAVLFVIVPPKKVQHAFFLIFCLWTFLFL